MNLADGEAGEKIDFYLCLLNNPQHTTCRPTQSRLPKKVDKGEYMTAPTKRGTISTLS